MPITSQFLTATSLDNAVRKQAGADWAFLRTRDILRQDAALTVEQFHELDDLFSRISPTQFKTLTSDDLHLKQLRQYEIMAWRHPRAAAPVLAVVLIILAAIFVAMTWG